MQHGSPRSELRSGDARFSVSIAYIAKLGIDVGVQVGEGNPLWEWSLMDSQERYRRAVAALNAYCENRKNPLSGKKYLKLVGEIFAAMDALKKVQTRDQTPERSK